MSQRRLHLFNQPAEEKDDTLFYITQTIASDNEQEKQKVGEQLAKIDTELLIKYFKNPQIKKFCETNPVFQTAIKQKLTVAGYIDSPVTAMDETKSVSTLDLYLAVFYYKKFYQEKGKERLEYLNQSCELGLYQALLDRCILACKDIQKTPSNSREKLTKLLDDLDYLANLYWGIGYIQAGTILLNLSKFFEENPHDGKLATNLKEKAMIKLLSAYYLRDHKYSNSIFLSLQKDLDVAALLQANQIPCVSWEEVIKMCQDLAGKRFADLQKFAVDETFPFVKLELKLGK